MKGLVWLLGLLVVGVGFCCRVADTNTARWLLAGVLALWVVIGFVLAVTAVFRMFRRTAKARELREQIGRANEDTD
jgi:protein-S-isoprenylcysteine O-methyltransferase Ste14